MGNTVFGTLLIFLAASTITRTSFRIHNTYPTKTHSAVGADTSNPTLKANPPAFTSKYDFVPGEKILLLEDFSAVEPGDFPAGWNTNVSGEVVVFGDGAKWLKLAQQGSYYPEIIKPLPQQMTLEFYLQASGKPDPVPLVINFGPMKSREEFKWYDGQNPALRGQPVFQLRLLPGNANKAAVSEAIAGRRVNYDMQNKNNFKTWDNAANNTAHVALWRQGERLRVYINGEKVWDLPRAFDTATKYNLVFAMPRSRQGDDYYLLGNMRLAVGAPDTRSKLLKEGRFVTQGILFNSGSDVIKPESFGILKEIAGLLEESPATRLRIIGHTDSDGDEKSNLQLSQRRAAAVKAALVSTLGIKAERLETDGKGQSKPVADNKTKEGKAQNRRVEFIKL